MYGKALSLPRGWPEVLFVLGLMVLCLGAELASSFLRQIPMDWAMFGVQLGGAASLLLVRRAPLLAAALLAITPMVYYVFGAVDSIGAWVPFAIGVVWLAMERQRLAAVACTVLAILAFGIPEFTSGVPLRAIGVFSWVLIVLAVGEIARNRRAYLREVEQRAADAERTREEEARRRASEERLRIARELHDVLAHQISLINVQAAAAGHRRDPEQAFAALDAIKAASKDTLRELRSILGVLRAVDAPEEGAASLTPTPSVRHLEQLVEHTRRAGMAVEVEVGGAEGPLPAAVDAAAYRIAQEALTNALRHSGASAVRVYLGYGERTLTLRVTDDGRGLGAGHPGGGGNGMNGMRERATAVGGTVRVATRPEGGTEVAAEFPLPVA